MSLPGKTCKLQESRSAIRGPSSSSGFCTVEVLQTTPRYTLLCDPFHAEHLMAGTRTFCACARAKHHAFLRRRFPRQLQRGKLNAGDFGPVNGGVLRPDSDLIQSPTVPAARTPSCASQSALGVLDAAIRRQPAGNPEPSTESPSVTGPCT